MEEIIRLIAGETNQNPVFVRGAIELLQGGATVPFISRYRKEATGGMNEVMVEKIQDMYLGYTALQKRKEYIVSTIEAQGKLTETLTNKIAECWDAQVLEDLYLPYKPHRKTRADSAKAKGLEPLAKEIMRQGPTPLSSAKYVGKEVENDQEALQGACDIIAAWINEDSRARQSLRTGFERTGIISSKVIKGKEEEGQKYRNYFDASEPLRRISSHRLLAMRRGQNEGYLRVSIAPSPGALEHLRHLYVKGTGEKSDLVSKAVDDAYKRLLAPSIENEFATLTKRQADLRAIEVFASSLKALLLAPPLGGRQMMAIDPGIRTGCKVVILNPQGDLLHFDTIYPHASRDKMVYAEMQVLKMLHRFAVEVIAIGSGTAGRETREFIESLEPGEDIDIYMVNEDGASVYSASEVARREFPDHDVTVRGAVSIGRRLMDPLAELVKIDPKAIGVGQYQHDVDQSLLRQKLASVTQSCVNQVGVNLNTASAELLSYVSGIGPSLATSIVAFRNANGPFRSRRELKKVPRLGPKVYEQCAGFLRIPESENPLDGSAIHPERYALVQKMAKDLGTTVNNLLKSAELRSHIKKERYVNPEEGIGLETLTDILAELEKPGRDPRPTLKKFEFAQDISSIVDLREGMILPARVANVTDFGAFADLGIKTKGLIHISQLSEKRVKDPRQVVEVGRELQVKVLSIDLDRNRIALTLKGVEQR